MRDRGREGGRLTDEGRQGFEEIESEREEYYSERESERD